MKQTILTEKKTLIEIFLYALYPTTLTTK